MATFTFADSQYRFIEPIRFFKANDPYYWEVDNIPIKQLQENCLWLRDQIQKISSTGNSGPGTIGAVKRSDFDELKPYSTGADRVVRVRPGRFSARINNITKNPLAQYLELNGSGFTVDDTDIYKIYTGNNTSDPLNVAVYNALEKFKSSLAINAMNMNGLTERAFTWAVTDVNTPSPFALSTSDSLSYVNALIGNTLVAPFVYSQVVFPYVTSLTDKFYQLRDYDYTDSNIGFSRLPLIESVFIKRWGGIARTAIVDVPSELTVEVPPFDPEDYFYINESGQKITQVASGRVDLVFIYSKPVDASAATVFKNGVVTQLTEPALGIVRGAGLGPVITPLASQLLGGQSVVGNFNTALDENGNPQIQAHVADANQTTQTGFLTSSGTNQTQTVRGSFPSPDDLLNLAPLICNELETNAIELVGQSILPVAYVFVPAVGATAAASDLVDSEDIIDIRPLLRTTELTYNERAGIAAAVPQLSLANPAVGKAELNRELYKVSVFVKDEIEKSRQIGAFSPPFVAAQGYVFGGWQYGPEAVLMKKEAKDTGFGTGQGPEYIGLKRTIVSDYGFIRSSAPDSEKDSLIPELPNWEVADWCAGLELAGNYPADRLFVLYNSTNYNGEVPGGTNAEQVIEAGSHKRVYNTGNPSAWLTDPNAVAKNIDGHGGSQGSGGTRNSFISYYVRKTITFTRPSNLYDYDVDVDFINCSKIRNGLNTDNQYNRMRAGLSNYWIEKGQNSFTIYIPIDASRDPWSNYVQNVPTAHPKNLREVAIQNSAGMEGIVVLTKDIAADRVTKPYYNAPTNRFGLCMYPTIRWRLLATRTPEDGIGVPQINGGNSIGNLYGF